MTKSRIIRWIVVIAAVAALGYFGWNRYRNEEQAAAAKNAPARPAVRVTIAPVEKSDFPVYLTGLGTVQGFNTVVVRTRIDGQIDKVAFKEGQLVNQGDLLVEIDPRPFQAALDPGQGQEGRARRDTLAITSRFRSAKSPKATRAASSTPGLRSLPGSSNRTKQHECATPQPRVAHFCVVPQIG